MRLSVCTVRCPLAPDERRKRYYLTSPVLLVILHIATALALAAYGLHRLVLAIGYLRTVRRLAPSTPPAEQLPSVTVQIPLYNERHVAERAVHAAGALDYPTDRLEIQVLDDSTDETSAIVARAVEALCARGVQVRHVRRDRRVGYKAGALAHGLASARGDLIAVFDADFVPPPDFLRRVVGHFENPGVGMVQTRWGHLNRDTSTLTRAQALQLDAHFTIEHGVRAAIGCFFNFNGTAGVWRRRAIEDAGGWRADTLTEDLDLSYRAQLAGWRFVYRDDVEVPAELPVEVAAYRQQQERWAQGGVATAHLILPTILRAPLPGRVRWEAFWHLTAHFAYPLLLMLGTIGLVSLWAGEPLARRWAFAADGVLLAFATLALGFFYAVAARARLGRRWWRALPLVPVIMVLGAGIAVGQTLAVYRGLTGRTTAFRRTPKYRLERATDGGWRASAYRLITARGAVAECVAGAAVLLVAGATALHSEIGPPGMTVMFGLGFLAVGGGALVQDRRQSRGSPRSGP